MRKPIGLFIAAFATVAGGGLAFAVEGEPGGPPEETPPVELPAAAQHDETDDVEVEDTTDVDELEAAETEEIEVESEPEGDHGAWVSDAAQNSCQDQTEMTHGECVSAAARDHDHDGTADHGRGSPDHPGQGGPNTED